MAGSNKARLLLEGEMPMKVAIYARYSSDNQRDASIADQFRVCHEFVRRQSWKIEQEYADHAVSGATVLRPSIQALMRDALADDSMSSAPNPSTGSVVTKKTPPACLSA